ncbi:MAG: AraC family transcriptional regulator [Chitinophagaceae bacterium]
MIGLQRGNYLGKADSIVNADGIIVSLTSYPDTAYSENLHYHETLHMSFVLRGGNLEKRIGYDIERVPGVVTFYDAGELHQSTKTIGGSKHVNVEIEDRFLQQYGLGLSAEKIRSLRSPDAVFMMTRLLKELRAQDDLSEVTIHGAMLNFLQAAGGIKENEKTPPWLHVIYEYLHDRWDESISLEDLSVIANVHPVTISKYFPKYFGCTIGEYMRKLKVEQAILLIKTSPYSLTEVAAFCGFADQSHFIRAFKQQTGFAPKYYQKLLNC